LDKDIGWNELPLSLLILIQKECELEIQMIIHSQISQSIIKYFY